MKTQLILSNLKKYGTLELNQIYEVANANTKRERHSVRGILSGLYRRGLIVHKGIGCWGV